MSDNVQLLSDETQKTETVKNEVVGKSENRGNRILYIDFLKFIGLSGIILAHVGVPDLVMMIRNFDVPLMVILSSMLAYRSYAKHVKNGSSTLSYYISRTKRLVIPTWIFLVIFFAATIILTGKHQSVKYYIASFCLTRYGIGYVWVILIYLYSALLIPLFYKLQFTAKVTAALLVIYGLYEVAYYFRLGTQIKLIDTTFYYIIPYGVLTYLGYHYCKMSQRLKYLIILASCAAFIAFGIYYWIATGAPQNVQIAKYPPRLYYLGYGVACSFGLICLCEKHEFGIYQNRVVRFVSMHSMWIYLWHILALSAYKMVHLPEIWYVKFFVVYIVSAIIVIVVNKCLDLIERRRKFAAIKYLRG